MSVSVVLIAAFAAFGGWPVAVQPAMNDSRSWRGRSVIRRSGFMLMATESPSGPPEADTTPTFLRPRERPWWMQIGFGNRPPQPPVVGPAAQVQWWERIRSLVILAALVLILGLVLAGLIGAVVALGGYLLEQTAT
ncbi:MAG: hypothetical protein ACR2QE_15435 [Acidimicrobiales bacterium]